MQHAIVSALLEKPGCAADPAAIEAYVRQMNLVEKRLWAREPDVILHAKKLRGHTRQSLPAALLAPAQNEQDLISQRPEHEVNPRAA
jgi:hypothetical protein